MENSNGFPEALSLRGLSEALKSCIRSQFSRAFWVRAEMARLNHYPQSGHCYPDLVEKEGGDVKAQMRATIWADAYREINRKFVEVLQQELTDGMSILFRATISYHALYGLNLNIISIEPAFTLGAMAMDKQIAIGSLKKLGVFDLNRQLPFPDLPSRLAVISVQTSKGYSDFMRILNTQASAYRISVTLFPALLQGDKAVDSIRDAMETVLCREDEFDALAIIRGGGGDIGLSCYDNFELARDVACFPLPVITGIGHSTNETVCQMVAAVNKITPTDVAYFILGKFTEAENRLSQCLQQMQHDLGTFFAQHYDFLKNCAAELAAEASEDIDGARRSLGSTASDIIARTQFLMKHHEADLYRVVAGLGSLVPHIMRNATTSLDQKIHATQAASFRSLSNAEKKLDGVGEKLALLDPERVLKRGYSITRFEGKVVKSASGIPDGAVISTTLYQGNIESVIKNK